MNNVMTSNTMSNVMNTQQAQSRVGLYTLAVVIASTIVAMMTISTEARSQTRPVVNINTATEAELQLLPGVGPKLASAINDYKEACCDHRASEGAAFRSVEDLLRVKGIKARKLEQLRPYVVVSGETTAKAKIKLTKPAKTGRKPAATKSKLPRDGRRCPDGARC